MKNYVIPTRGIVVFPGQVIKIDVGRLPSVIAVKKAIHEHGGNIVILSQKEITKDSVERTQDLYLNGTIARIDIEKELSNVLTISVSGLNRFKVNSLKFTEGSKVIVADGEIMDIVDEFDKEDEEFIKNISKELVSTLKKSKNIPQDILNNLEKNISTNSLIDIISQFFPFQLVEKQNLITEPNVTKRLKLISRILLKSNTDSRDVDKKINSNVRKTLDSQQKEFLLREKLKAIKQELGEISSKESEIEKWTEALKDKKFPKDVREKALEEIKKYESMPPISAESNVTKSYVEWLIKLPWKTYSVDNKDLKKAKFILDRDHYALRKVKERIIEYLAVKINTNSKNSPIITLVGPPGVGKTSMAKAIAEAVGREFVKVSLGGLRDEAEVRGHRRTYVGALPGKIINAISKAKTSSPVILLDEIDKMSSDYRGDPTSAMLEVLDPEQNAKFQDHYLEIEYDLSKVMFIATANYIERIPEPLYDRVELVELRQYTSVEKIEIAKRHIIPEIIKDNGLTKSTFNISSETINYVIDKYTREAGVRSLRRNLDKLARKIVVKKLSGEVKSTFTITKAKVVELLGKEKIYREKLKGKAEIGLVNGMYYSSAGGGILPIEVTTYKSSKPEIELTGSIKTVMKESLNIAIGYLRANQEKFGFDFDFDSNSIHVHVPEGAQPKDGPSAGIAFASAVLSALSKKPIPKEVALTGEITLRGDVLPIGGLREKSLGAVEAGVKKIFIPKNNEKDLDDLVDKVKENAEIIAVKNYIDVYNHLFK